MLISKQIFQAHSTPFKINDLPVLILSGLSPCAYLQLPFLYLIEFEMCLSNGLLLMFTCSAKLQYFYNMYRSAHLGVYVCVYVCIGVSIGKMNNYYL